MRRRILPLTALLLVLIFATTIAVQAKTDKYTFNDVTIGERTVEIEAGVKTTNKNDYTNCSYFSDDYAESLGYYQAAEARGDTAATVLEFCVNHFDDRVQ